MSKPENDKCILRNYTVNILKKNIRFIRCRVVQIRKEMFYLTTHSTQFILRLYGVGHMVKDHSDRGNLLPPHGLLFPINSKGSFICTIPTDRIAHTMEREIAQWGSTDNT